VAGADRLTALYLESPDDAVLDVAVSHALLRSGRAAFRLWTPPPAVSFGRLDLLSPGADRAVASARDAGLTPVRRLAGGRVAAIGPWTVCVGAAAPGPHGPETNRPRYEWLSGVIVQALRSLQVDARLGELEGEWCPGSWSVLVGSSKVAGLAQRVIRLGAWVEAVIVVEAPASARRALAAVQGQLGVEWDPATFGGLSGVTSAEVVRALRRSLGPSLETRLPAELWELAHSLRMGHFIP